MQLNTESKENEYTLKPEQAASLLGVTEGTLRRWRRHPEKKKELPFLRMSPLLIRYSMKDISNYVKIFKK